MFRANEHLVAHNQNIGLVFLRNSEVIYFVNFFGLFGTQCILLCTFVLSSISQLPALESECHIFWKYMYWVTIAISFIVSFNSVLNTVYICVYGQGMAIRGPQGSMVKAVEGFDIEQDQVMISFVITMIFTALSTVATYWVVMDTPGALLSCAITLIGFYYWYKHAIRIYNRFKWDKDDQTSWHRGSDEQPRYVLEHKAYLPPIQQGK